MSIKKAGKIKVYFGDIQVSFLTSHVNYKVLTVYVRMEFFIEMLSMTVTPFVCCRLQRKAALYLPKVINYFRLIRTTKCLGYLPVIYNL
jgi:hypothetical protein